MVKTVAGAILLHVVVQLALVACPSVAAADVISDALASMPSNSWKKINLNQFQDVWTPEVQRPTFGSPHTNISAWSGAAWDSRRKNLLIWGGDQVGFLQDSEEGNEVYIFETASGLWKRGSLPSQITATNGIVHTVDGIFNAPISGESWDNVVYLENVDRVAVIGVGREGQTFKALDGSATGPYFWDPAKADAGKVSGLTGSQVNPSLFPNVLGGAMWQNRDNFPSDTGLALRGVTGHAIENGKDVIYFSGQRDALWRYTVQDLNSANDTWELIGTRPWSGIDGDGSGDVDPDRQIFVKTLTANSFGFWDVSTRAVSPENREIEVVPALLTGAPAMDFRDFGLRYDPTLRAFLLWGGDSDVWQLDPPANLDPDGDGIKSEATGWTLRRIDPAGDGPTLPAAFTGVFGKWAYLPAERAYLGVIDPVAGDVFLYKPEYNKAPPATEVALTADPVSVPAGGTTQLTWTSTNATSCEASGGWSGSKPTDGSATIGPIIASTKFSISCSGLGGTKIGTVTITATGTIDPPTIALSATPGAIGVNGYTALQWSSSGATSCTAAGGPWSGTKSAQGGETVGPLSTSTTFSLSCTGLGGTTTRMVTVSVVTPPSIRLVPNPALVPAGGTSQLTWTSTDAASCVASGGWSGAKPTNGSASIGPIAASTEYSLTCTGVGGTVVETVIITIARIIEPPVLALAATPTAVARNSYGSIEWTSSNATSCTAAGGPWTGTKPTNGSESVGPLSSTTAFTLSCSGSGGTAMHSVTVNVVAAPSVQLTASPVSVSAGGRSSLTWSSNGATACFASGSWAGSKATDGTEQTGPLDSSGTFELECTGTGGATKVSTTVTVLPAAAPSAAAPSAGSSQASSGGGGAADLLLGLGLVGLGLSRRRALSDTIQSSAHLAGAPPGRRNPCQHRSALPNPPAPRPRPERGTADGRKSCDTPRQAPA